MKTKYRVTLAAHVRVFEITLEHPVTEIPTDLRNVEVAHLIELAAKQPTSWEVYAVEKIGEVT